MAKIPETGPVTIAQIAAEWQGPEDLAELSKKSPILKSGTEEVSVDDFRGEYYYWGTEAVGGDITTDGEYRYHTFTTPGTFQITKGGFGQDYNTVDVIIVAGGGGCGCPTNTGGSGAGVGGGGAGGVITASFASEPVTKTISKVGAGGRSEPSNYKNYGQRGGDTQVVGFTVAAGGAGTGMSGTNTTVSNGGCSGGRKAGSSANHSAALPPSPSGQGYAGGASGTQNVEMGGGGGGAGGAGGASAYTHNPSNYPPMSYTAGGNGGAGKLWHGVRYSGGGGGGGHGVGGGMAGSGGSGGGGKAATFGASDNTKLEDPGAAPYFWGGGAGASGLASVNGSYVVGPVYTGYQGVVIFRYKVIPDVTRDTEFADRTFAPAIEPQPNYDPMTHYAELNAIENPRQKSVGWTVYELTEEQKADNVRVRAEIQAEIQAAMKEMEE
jgi:hypothetical protein